MSGIAGSDLGHAMTGSAGATATTPLAEPVRIGGAGLAVRDLAACEAFYRSVIGLEVVARAPDRVLLGVGHEGILELIHEPAAIPDDPHEAGLFHLAFLVPTRADLADWVGFAAAAKVRLEGASDHSVSEAMYLSDPDGNGVEVYADRPRAAWQYPNGRLRITTERLDLDGLLAARSEGGWRGAPAGTRIGHVHLRVGDVAEARAFWTRDIGLDLIAAMPAAAFLSSGGYHHHVATNVWQSAGAGRREPRRAGLAFVHLDVSRGKAVEDELRDPWDTVIRRSAAPMRL
jgi:catechol 2,3-dioxygenase